MRTLDEVIKNLEDGTEHLSAMLISRETWTDALQWLKGYKAHIELDKLRDKCEAENEPLSWSELLQMVGKPVWVEVLDEYGDHYKWHGTKYYIVKEFSKGFYGEYCHLEPNERTFTKSAYGDTWQAYRKER